MTDRTRLQINIAAAALLLLAPIVWLLLSNPADDRRWSSDDEIDAIMPAEGYVRSHAVLAGESLWSIAQAELGDGKRWREIAALNGLRSPYKIRVGMRLLLP